MRVYPAWVEFHSRTIGGPIATVRSRSGVVRLEMGEGELADRVLVGIPDDDTWLAFADTLEAAGFWEWPADIHHQEPHADGDWYWRLEVRTDEREHRAAEWNHAPDGFDQVSRALLDLVDQVAGAPASDAAPSRAGM